MEWLEAKHLLGINKYPEQWFGTDYTMNLYRGCHHGCIYCDVRSECYQVADFDTVAGKRDCLSLLTKELSSKRQKKVIGTGAMSDPYNQFEKSECLTAGSLEIINHYQFGVVTATKSDLITRDIARYQQIQRHSPVLLSVSITTPYDDLSKKIERHVSPSSKRFTALEKLAEAGLPTCLLLMPVLPKLTDQPEAILQLVRQAHRAGVTAIYPWFGMTLRDRQRDYYYRSLDRLFPDLSQQYRSQFGSNYFAPADNQKSLIDLFENECTKLAISYQMPNIIQNYQAPYGQQQLTLF